MLGAAIMEESEEAELTDEDTWDIVKDFIVSDHTPLIRRVARVLSVCEWARY